MRAAVPLLSVLVFLFAAARAVADPAAAPQVSFIYPAGGQRGTTVKLTVGGSDLAGITGFYTNGTGLTAKILPGGDANSRILEVTVAADAPLGIQQVRVYNAATGLSNARFFRVGQFPETLEKEPNDTVKDAPRVTLPITVNGKVEGDADRDGVTFHARPGETVVCEVEGLRVLGQVDDSWLKGYLEVCDAAGKVLAASEGTSDDYYRWDPLIAFDPPAEGDYTVFFRDLNWRGSARAVYRLTIGVVPHALGIFPLGGRRGANVAVHFTGPNLKDATKEVAIPADAPDSVDVSFDTPAGTTNARPFHVSDLPDVPQAPGNHVRAAAQEVPFPCVVNGRIEQDGVQDFYTFSLKEPKKVAVEVFSRRVGTPMDPETVLFDAQGKQVGLGDDERGRDSRIEADLTPGEYTIQVRDIDERGGPAFPYRLAIAPPRPSFHLVAMPDAPKLARGGTATITIKVDRQDGFDGEIAVSLKAPPPGVTAAPLTLAKDKQEGQLTLTAAADAPLGPVRIEITGTGTAGDHPVTSVAVAGETYNIQGTAFQRELVGPILFVTEK